MTVVFFPALAVSPSSRRAWIEIEIKNNYRLRIVVALLAEGVDRNTLQTSPDGSDYGVALLAEGVDRNCKISPRMASALSRPPRGGRG